MGREKIVCYILILGSVLCVGVHTQTYLENMISDDKLAYDFQGCNCDNSIDSKTGQEIKTSIEELASKVNRIKESIYKLTQLTEILLNNSSNQSQVNNSEFWEDTILQQTSAEFETTTVQTLPNKPIFDEHFNCVENCGLNSPLPKNCDEALSDDASEEGIYLLSDDRLAAFGAYCMRYDRKGWTIIQRRSDGAEDFYRNWSAYKHGFGNLSAAYWLGLERLHAMTSLRSHELWIYWQSRDNIERYARYSMFYISDEEDGYRLTVTGYSGDAGDALWPYNGNAFSTFLEENDVSHNSFCVEETKSAWWYWSCAYMLRYASLNGEYRPATNSGRGVFWWSDGEYKSLKYVHMAIRSV